MKAFILIISLFTLIHAQPDQEIKNIEHMPLHTKLLWGEKGFFRHNRRIRCAIKFEEIIRVQSKNINQKDKNTPLECLAIECKLIADTNYEIKIFFSGGSVITLISEAVEVSMHDLGKSWKVKHVPIHKI